MTSSSQKFHMRRKDKELTNPEEIRNIIKNTNVCHLGLIDGDEPYIVPVNFGYEENCLYFHSALEGRKVGIIKKNNKVCFNMVTDVGIKTVTDKCKVKYKSVTGNGIAYIVEDEAEKIRGLRAIMRQNMGREYDFELGKLKSTLVVRIDILDMKGKQSA